MSDTGVALLDQQQPSEKRGLFSRRVKPRLGEEISAAKVRTLWKEAGIAQRVQTYQYWLNRAFLLGEQWVFFNKMTQRVERVIVDDSRVRASNNRLWPSTLILMGKMLRRELVFEVDANEPDDASLEGAEIAEAVLEAAHEAQNWERLRSEHAYAVWLGGSGALALDWDASAGVLIEPGEEPGARDVGTGDVVGTALSVAEIATEPGSTDIEHARYWIRAQALPPKQVQEMFELAETPAADAIPGVEPVTGRFASIDQPIQPVKLTLVLRYYERPSSLTPGGAVAVVVGEQIVDGPHPWPFPFTDRLNIALARQTPVAGRWAGDTVFSAALPVQTLLNAAESSLAEHQKLAGNARLMLPDAALDGIEELSDLPGEIVPWSGEGSPPAWLGPAPLSDWVIDRPQMLKADLDDILNVHDVSRGTTSPDGPQSGVGISYLMEQDDTPTTLMSKECADCWGRYATMVLETLAAKVEDRRVAKVASGTKYPRLVPWTGKDLAGQTTAHVPLEAVLPRSRAAQMQMAISLMQSGVIPAGNTTLFAQIAELPNQEQLWEGIDPDIAKARRENLTLSLGLVCLPEHFDDHPKHINEHNRQRKSSRYERASKAMRKIIDDHVKAHEIMEAEALAEKLKQQAVSPDLAGMAQAHGPTPLAGEGGASPPQAMPAPPAPGAENAPVAEPAPPDAGAPPAGPEGPPALGGP